MIVNWEDVDSTAVLAIAYDAEAEAIHVRFHSGAEWRYFACSPAEWTEFQNPLVSKGRYVNDVLKRKPAERLA
jgi:KTSC domain